MNTMKQIIAKDVKEDVSSKVVTDYFKQSGVISSYKLLAVIPDETEADTLIALAEDTKWSPYSERSKYSYMYFRKGETSPWKIEVTPIDDTVMTADEAVRYLSEMAVKTAGLETDDADSNFVNLSDAIARKDLLVIEKWIDQDPNKPYINMADIDLDELKAALLKKEAA